MRHYYYRGLTTTFILIFLCSTSVLYAQKQSSSDIDLQKLVQKGKELDGTFQIEMKNTRSLPNFHVSLYEKIISLRDETEIVYYEVSDIMRLKILPKSIINLENFQPVERTIYISIKTKDL